MLEYNNNEKNNLVKYENGKIILNETNNWLMMLEEDMMLRWIVRLIVNEHRMIIRTSLFNDVAI